MNTDNKRKGRRARKAAPAKRQPNYKQLRHPFAPAKVFSDDQIAAMHEAALNVLETLGLKILLPEARQIFAAGGAKVNNDTEMVLIGRDIVEAALHTTPRSIRLRAINPTREQIYEPGTLIFKPSGGCPNATDAIRGRRPGDAQTYDETVKLVQSYDVIQGLSLSAEPQDIPANLRHYRILGSQMRYGDKPPFVFCRGRQQVQDNFDLLRLGWQLSEDEFTDGCWATTIINTNSPRQIDKPMAEGIIDFARAGQLCIITPFCLAGAMAPITIAGALVLQHAEALAGITLSQLTKPGAPVSYGGFASNVDMKSGAPAFGTPEHVKLMIGTGQLARHLNLPFRAAAGSASNTADAQGATENTMGLWACLMANATMIVHSVGWLEGGLTFGYEKFITDMEAVQTLAELCAETPADIESMGHAALADVPPGGHFFATPHTMERFDTAFYDPMIWDLSNNGTWVEAGAQTAAERATAVWQKMLAEYTPPPSAEGIEDRIAPFIEQRTKEGGAAPVS